MFKFDKNNLLAFLFFSFYTVNFCLASQEVEVEFTEDNFNQVEQELENNINIFFKKMTDSLNEEKIKLESFKESFFILLDIFADSKLSKDQKIVLVKKNVDDSVLLLDSLQIISNFNEELKDQIIALGQLMIIFIENEEVDLDKLSQDVSYIIQTLDELTQMLQDQSNFQAGFSDKENDNDLPTKGVAYIKTKEKEKVESKVKPKEKIIRRGAALAVVQHQEESKSKKAIKKVEKTAKKIGDATLKAFSELGDFRLGGYPAVLLTKIFKNY
jgi:hypothetical protein